MAYVLLVMERLLYKLAISISKANARKLSYLGVGVTLGRGLKFEFPEFISLGDNVVINDYCWFSVVENNIKLDQSKQNRHPKLTVGAGTYIGRFCTFACIDHICIGDDVLISDRVFIGDAVHGFILTNIPIKNQEQSSSGPVTIGDGTWIGIGASILPNVKVGKNCVIGANSVVTKDVPDFCVAVGNPAKVIRQLGK